MKMLKEIHTDFAAVAASQHEVVNQPRWQELHEQALAQFERSGLPGKKEEDWKYTSLWAFGQQAFQHLPVEPSHVDATPYQLNPSAYRLVIVDGMVDRTASNIEDLPAGVRIQPLSESIDAVADYLNATIELEKPGFNALNTMLMHEGVFVEVDAGVSVDKPLELIVINSGNTVDLAVHLRNVIVMGENSQFTFIENYVSEDSATGFTDVVTESSLAEKAVLTHYKMQRESSQQFHIATMASRQARDSQWLNHNISLGGGLARNDIHTQLLGEQAHVTMNGLYLISGKQHVDNHSRVDHAVPHTSSEELYKGVLDDKSHAVFNGKVHVHPDAQKTDANQANHNLLISRGAEIDTKPEMEIYADDVVCGHGSTVGQLDLNQLFFLRTRGLDEKTARGLLTFAFAADVIERIEDKAMREAITQMIETRLPKP